MAKPVEDPIKQPAPTAPAPTAPAPIKPASPAPAPISPNMGPTAQQNNDYGFAMATQGPLPYGYRWELQKQQQTGIPPRSYWEDPTRVARYYHAIHTLPAGATVPTWLDAAAVDGAYKYLQQRNMGRPWYTWRPLNEQDPGNDLLRSMAMPPPEGMPGPERQQYYPPFDAAQQQTDNSYYPLPLAEAQKAFSPDVLAAFPKQGDNVLISADYIKSLTGTQSLADTQNFALPETPTATGPGGMPQEQYDALPGWQKAIITASPWLNTVMMGGMTGLAGLSIAGPVGGVIGLVGGAALGKLQEQNQVLAKVMAALQVPAQWMEGQVGALGQLASAVSDPEKYGTVKEVLDNWDAAVQAGQMAYNVSFQDFGKGVTAHQVGNPEAQQWKAPDGQIASSWALTEGRRRIMQIMDGRSTETVDQVVQDIQSRFGFESDIKDMVGQMLIDPLNLIGDFANAGIYAGAKVAKNVPLADAALMRSQIALAPVNFVRGMEGAKNFERTGYFGTDVLRSFAAGKENLLKANNMAANDVLDVVKLYGQKLREMPTEEAMRFGSMSRWIAGMDANGQVRHLVKGDKVGLLDYLRGLDPKSRATETLADSVNGLQTLLRDEPDPVKAIAYLDAIAKVNPEQAVKALEDSPLPKWFRSAEGQATSIAIKELTPKAHDLLDRYTTTREAASRLQFMADAMSTATVRKDVYALMKELHEAKPEEAQTIFRAFVQSLQSRKLAGDKRAANFLESLTKDPSFMGLDGLKLKDYAGLFMDKDAAPFSVQEFKGQLFHMLTAGVEDYAVKYFGVKPPNWAIRTGDLVKRAQGLVLLGLNPTFLINNAINNLVTLGWDGLLSGSTARSRLKWLRETGIKPVRLRAGNSAAEIGDAHLTSADLGGYKLGEKIKRAGRIPQGDIIQQLTDFARGSDKLAIFANLSGKFEQWSSEVATVNAMRGFLDQIWVEGRGITQMPADTEQALSAFGGQKLVKKVKTAIRKGKTKEAIEKLVFQDLGKPTLHDVMTPDEMRLLDHFPGMLDEMETRIGNAKTDDDIRGVFSWAQSHFMEQLANDAKRNIRQTVDNAATKVSAEGPKGALDLNDLHMQERADFWNQHFDSMNDLAEEAAKYSGQARQAVWQRGLDKADQEWRIFQNLEGAKWKGVLEGLGTDETDMREAENLMFGMNGNWTDFYQTRRMEMDSFFAASEGKDKATRSQLWLETNQRLNKAYADALLTEDDLQQQLDEVFIKSYTEKFKDNPNAKAQAEYWRLSVQLVRRRMGLTQAIFREGGIVPPQLAAWQSLLPPDLVNKIVTLTMGQQPFAMSKDRRQAVTKQFMEGIYRPYVREMLEASNANDPARNIPPEQMQPIPQPVEPSPVSPATPAAAAPVRPTPADATPVEPKPVEAQTPAARSTTAPDQFKKGDVAYDGDAQVTIVDVSHSRVGNGPLETTYTIRAEDGVEYDIDPKHLSPLSSAEQAAAAAAKQADEIARANRNGVFKTASEHGIGSTSPGDRKHILNILKQVYAVSDIDQVTPEMAQQAFQRRELFKGAVDLHAQAQLDKRILEFRARQIERNLDNLTLQSPKRFTRDAFFREAEEQLGTDKASEYMLVMDQIAKHWADENNKTIDDWYDDSLLERGGTEGPTGLVQPNKGVTQLLENGKAVIHAFEAADVSTFIHETAHVWLPKMGKRDLAHVTNWLQAEYGIVLPDGWEQGTQHFTQAKEYFARAFERYMAEGVSPVPSMRSTFEKFKNWLLGIYGAISGSDIDVRMNDEIRGVFDDWMGKAPAAAAETAAPAPVAPAPAMNWRQAVSNEIGLPYDQIRRTVWTNPISGIGNQLAFNQRVGRLTEEYYIIAADMRGLKATNDTFGHSTGDMLLHVGGIVLKDLLGDDAYHLHGDEYAGVVVGTRADAERIAAELTRRMNGVILELDQAGQKQYVTGYGMHVGIGDVYDTADRAANAARNALTGEPGTDARLATKPTTIEGSDLTGRLDAGAQVFAGRNGVIDVTAEVRAAAERATTLSETPPAIDNPQTLAGYMKENDLVAVDQEGNVFTPEVIETAQPAQPEPVSPRVTAETPKLITPTIRRNAEHQGIEVSFDAKPSEQTIATLKHQGYKWSSRQKVWYKKEKPGDWERLGWLRSAPESARIITPEAQAVPAAGDRWPTWDEWREKNYGDSPITETALPRNRYNQMVIDAVSSGELGYAQAVDLVGENAARVGMVNRLRDQATTLTRDQFITAIDPYLPHRGEVALGRMHEDLIRSAMDKGETVSDEVLRDYPDLLVTKEPPAQPVQTVTEGLWNSPKNQGSLFGEEQAGGFSLISQKAPNETFKPPEGQQPSMFGMGEYLQAPTKPTVPTKEGPAGPLFEQPAAPKEPWQMTRAEFDLQDNGPKVEAIQKAIRQGKRITLATQYRVNDITTPDHIRLNSDGSVSITEGKKWVHLTYDQIDRLSEKAGYKLPELGDRVFHRAEVRTAIEEGKTVPPEVLADYPDLRPEPQPVEPAAPAIAKAYVLENSNPTQQTIDSFELGDLVEYHGKIYDVGYLSGGLVRLNDPVTHQRVDMASPTELRKVITPQDGTVKPYDTITFNGRHYQLKTPEGIDEVKGLDLTGAYPLTRAWLSIDQFEQDTGLKLDPAIWKKAEVPLTTEDYAAAVREVLIDVMRRNPDAPRKDYAFLLEKEGIPGFGEQSFHDMIQNLGGVEQAKALIDEVWDLTHKEQPPVDATLTIQPTGTSDFVHQVADMFDSPDVPFKGPRDFEMWAQQVMGLDMNDETNLNLAYDSLEGAFNLQSRKIRAELDSRNAPLVERVKAMAELENKLLRARRTISKMKLQQFSTPLPISEAAGFAGDVRLGDVVMEPTAGTANLVDRFYGQPGITVQVNELDAGRRKVLSSIGYNPTDTNVLGGEWVLKDGKRLGPNSSVVISNPPWGSYSQGKYGNPVNVPVALNDWSQRFTYLIMQRMPEGSRFVGVMPQNWLYTVDRKTREMKVVRSQFIKWLEQNYNLRAIIESPEDAYKTRGTNVGSLIVVFDKSAHKDLPKLEAWGENAPKTWEEYAGLVEQLGEGGKYARTAEDIQTSQSAIRTIADDNINAARQPDGPDATGLVDPAARTGEPKPDVEHIGEPAAITRRRTDAESASRKQPAAEPASGEPAARGSAEPGTGNARRPVNADEPTIRRAERKPAIRNEQPSLIPEQLDLIRGLDDAPGIESSDTGPVLGEPAQMGGGRGGLGRDSEQPGSIQSDALSGTDRNATTGPGAGGNPDAAMVAGQPGGISPADRRPLPEPIVMAKESRQTLSPEQQEVITNGVFAEYVGRSPVQDLGYNHHASTIVETKALSGIPYPELEPAYQPSPSVMDAYKRGALSLEGQLDPIWAAAQQNDKHHSGLLVADDVGMGKARTAAGFAIDRIEKGRKRILVVTKGNDNVTNLISQEFPGVYAGIVDNKGRILEPGKDFPARLLELNGDNFPNAYHHPSKKNFQYQPIPDYGDEPVVYFVAAHNLAYFREAFADIPFDTLIIDEAHEFKNVETQRGGLWYDLHKDALARNADFMYLSATPAADISELQYLYGLKLWTLDGFNDWIGIITGKLSPEMAQRKQETLQRLAEWEKNIREKAMAGLKEPEPVQWHDREYQGYQLDGGLSVFEYGKNVAIAKTVNRGQVPYMADVQLIPESSIPEGIAVAKQMLEDDPQVARNSTWTFEAAYRQARAKVERGRPKMGEDIRDAERGMAESDDMQQGNATKKEFIKRGNSTAFSSTLPPEHTEQIMREMKMAGNYMSRDLLRNGVEFNVLEYKPPAETLAKHGKRIELYRRLIDASYRFARMNKRDKLKSPLGAIQADAKRSLFDMRLTGAIEEAKKAIANGEQVVISLVSVSEADADRGNLFSAINAINTQEIENLGHGEYGDPSAIPEALIEQQEMFDLLRDLGTLKSPVEILRDAFGTDVGFITGAEKSAERIDARHQFQANVIPVVVISDAGKTGISLHDVTGKKRVHLIEADYNWSATAFKQELGRVDRTGQKTSPKVTILHMGNPGEVKFIATIANRMKGLGATAKGEAGSTGTGALNEQFEMGSQADRYAFQALWEGMDDADKGQFLDRYFLDIPKGSAGDDTRNWTPKTSIPATAETVRKFTMALQSMPIETAKRIMKDWTVMRDALNGEAAIERQYKLERSTGEMLRKTDLSNNLALYEVLSSGGHKFGIIQGVLTPYMNKLAKILQASRATDTTEDNPFGALGAINENAWRKWLNFTDAEGGHVSGIEVKPSYLQRVAKDFGQQISLNRAPETAMRDLRAGDKIPVRGQDGAEWTIYLGTAGFREGKVIVDQARMAQKESLMKNGAVYSAQGNFFYVPESNIDTFLKRFPIDNDRPLAQAMQVGETYLFDANGERYPAKYKVMPLDEVIQSHLDTFDPNPKYPSAEGIQPRKRDEPVYVDQVHQNARNLDERVLLETHMSDTGTPIIFQDGAVANGNGRIMFMRRARMDYPERWANYQKLLKERIGDYGLSEDDLQGIQDPVLVRVLPENVDRVKFATEAQASQSMRLTINEQAGADAQYVDNRALAGLTVGNDQTVEGALRSPANRDLAISFVNRLPASEKSQFIGKDGQLTPEGLTRLRNAIFVHVYPGEAGQRLANAFLASDAEAVRNVQAAIFDSLGIMSQAEALIREGKRAGDLSIVDDLAKAVDVYARLKGQGASIPDYLGQSSLIGDELDPMQKSLVKFIYDNSKSRKRLREMLALYADNVINVQQDPDQGSLFGGASSSKGEILDAVAEQVVPKQETEFAAIQQAANAPAEPPAPVESAPAESGAIPAAPVEPATPPADVPLGTSERFQEPPIHEAALEGWMKEISPMLKRAESAMLDPTNRAIGLSDLNKTLDPTTKKTLKRYLGQVYADLTDAKLATIKYGETKRDAALLNYQSRTGFDNVLGTVMPYEFWYTRSMLNWAIRALDRPAILANWARIRALQEKYTEGEGTVPTRLKKKLGIAAPFLPDWMGGKMYIDPLKQLFPFEQLTRPWETLANQKNLEEKAAEGNLEQMVRDEEITPQQAIDAQKTHAGAAWEKALAQARNSQEQDIQNPLDFAFMMSGPSLPISIAYNAATGNKDKISQLPITRLVQANTAAAGIGGPRGLNLEAPLRKTVGLPEVDRFEDYRVDRMLSNMAAEGMISADDAQRAMIDRQGPAFEQAQQRVSAMGVWQYWGSPLGSDMFPEGEKEQRALKTEYDAARVKYNDGDKTALTNFYDEHPEYEARAASFRDPADRLKRYLISEVWDRYNQLPSLYKTQVREQLGSTFADAFLDKETRSYDSISSQTLASWAQMLGGNNPAKAPDATQISLNLADPQIAKAVQDYRDAADARWPKVNDVLNAMYAMPEEQRRQFETMHPQIQAYYDWKNRYLASHPDIIPWVTSDQSELYGLPTDVQTHVYNYRAQKAELYPKIENTQGVYFGLPAGTQRRTYLKQHPELSEYWAWRKQMAAQYPKAAPYIMSDTSMQKAILGDQAPQMLATEVVNQMSPELLRGLAANVYTGEEIRAGAWTELERIWKDQGQPMGNLETWIQQAIKPAIAGVQPVSQASAPRVPRSQ